MDSNEQHRPQHAECMSIEDLIPRSGNTTPTPMHQPSGDQADGLVYGTGSGQEEIARGVDDGLLEAAREYFPTSTQQIDHNTPNQAPAHISSSHVQSSDDYSYRLASTQCYVHEEWTSIPDDSAAGANQPEGSGYINEHSFSSALPPGLWQYSGPASNGLQYGQSNQLPYPRVSGHAQGSRSASGRRERRQLYGNTSRTLTQSRAQSRHRHTPPARQRPSLQISSVQTLERTPGNEASRESVNTEHQQRQQQRQQQSGPFVGSSRIWTQPPQPEQSLADDDRPNEPLPERVRAALIAANQVVPDIDNDSTGRLWPQCSQIGSGVLQLQGGVPCEICHTRFKADKDRLRCHNSGITRLKKICKTDDLSPLLAIVKAEIDKWFFPCPGGCGEMHSRQYNARRHGLKCSGYQVQQTQGTGRGNTSNPCTVERAPSDTASTVAGPSSASQRLSSSPAETRSQYPNGHPTDRVAGLHDQRSNPWAMGWRRTSPHEVDWSATDRNLDPQFVGGAEARSSDDVLPDNCISDSSASLVDGTTDENTLSDFINDCIDFDPKE